MDTLEELRREIDVLDKQLVALIGKRMDVCKRVALYKKSESIPMMQHGRVATVIQRAVEMGRQYELDEEFMARFYQLIIDESCRLEDAIIEGGSEAPGASNR